MQMTEKLTRAIITIDGVYASKCEPRFTLYPRHREPRTLDDFERACRVFLRDTAMTSLQLEWRLAELREAEERGRALMCVAPLPFSNPD
jgi:hypothetical protein